MSSPARSLRFLAVASLACAWSLAHAEAQAPSTERVRALLSTYEEGPSAAEWRALGDATVGVLAALYDDPNEPFSVRLRAVEAAGHFPTRASRTFLLAVARAERQRDLVLRAAVLALGRAFGSAACDDVAAFLAHDDPDVREGAIVALDRMHDPRARAALRDHARVETRPHLRARIARALSVDLATLPGAAATGTTAPRP